MKKYTIVLLEPGTSSLCNYPMEQNNPAITYSTLSTAALPGVHWGYQQCCTWVWYTALCHQSSACELAPLKQEDSALLGKYFLLYTDWFPGICFFEFKS